MMNIS